MMSENQKSEPVNTRRRMLSWGLAAAAAPVVLGAGRLPAKPPPAPTTTTTVPATTTTAPPTTTPPSGGTSTESPTFTGTTTINGRLGVNKPATVRQPISMGGMITASELAGTEDKVAMSLTATAKGDFSGTGGSNPGFFWGLNLFATTGSTAGDGKGITDYTGALIEASIMTPAGTTFAHVMGLQAEAAFFGGSAGATVTQMESMRVSAPKRKDGAGGGTATNVYCLFIEDPEAYDTGASNSKFALFVEGGISRIQGRIDVDGAILSYNGNLSLQGNYSGAGKIQLTQDGIGFFGKAPVNRPTAVPVTAAGVHAALVTLGLITA